MDCGVEEATAAAGGRVEHGTSARVDDSCPIRIVILAGEMLVDAHVDSRSGDGSKRFLGCY